MFEIESVVAHKLQEILGTACLREESRRGHSVQAL